MWYLVKTLPIDVWASRRSFFCWNHWKMLFLSACTQHILRGLIWGHYIMNRAMRMKISLEVAKSRGDTGIWDFAQKFTNNICWAGPSLFPFMWIQINVRGITKIMGTWKIHYWPPKLAYYQFYKNAPKADNLR